MSTACRFGTSQLKYYRANKLVTPEEAFGERAKDVDFKPKRTLEEELDVLKEKVLHILWPNCWQLLCPGGYQQLGKQAWTKTLGGFAHIPGNSQIKVLFWKICRVLHQPNPKDCCQRWWKSDLSTLVTSWKTQDGDDWIVIDKLYWVSQWAKEIFGPPLGRYFATMANRRLPPLPTIKDILRIYNIKVEECAVEVKLSVQSMCVAHASSIVFSGSETTLPEFHSGSPTIGQGCQGRWIFS